MNINKIKSNVNILINDTPIEDKENLEKSTELAENLQENIDIEDFNNTIDEMKVQPASDVVLSPFVCTTRGQKWKPSPRKPPKLSELIDKYEEDPDVADVYK